MRYQKLRDCAKRRSCQPCLLPAVLLVLLTAGAASAGDKPPAVLSLDDGGFAAGELAPTDKPGVLSWQAASFVAPFEFKLGRVNAIHWTPAEKPVKPEGEFCFELGGGDVVFGTLAGLGASEAQLELPRIGRLHVDRSAIRRIYRWRESADLIYLGPNGLSGWTDSAPRRTLSPIPGLK